MMGAPFWSNEEKQYFLQHIVPRSHYANGFYESTGRSFEDLASVMQRDLDDRNLSRRTYNGDLLFQHWYQKVRPTSHIVTMAMASSSTHTPGPLPTTPHQGATTGNQPVHTQASAPANRQTSSPAPGSDDDQLTISEEDLSFPKDPSEQAMAKSTSPDGPSNAQDKGEVTEPTSSPLGARSACEVPSTTQSVTNTGMDSNTGVEPPSGAVDPTSAVPSTAPTQATKKRSLKETAKGDTAQTSAKKPKRVPKKSTARVRARDSDEDNEDGDQNLNPNPNSNTRGGSNDPSLVRRSGPTLTPHFEEYESPYHLSHPATLPSDSVLAASRELYNNSSSNAYNGSRPMHNTPGYHPRGPMTSSSTTRHPLPSSQLTPFTQEDADIARQQRRHIGLATGAFNTGPGYRGPGHSSVSVSGPVGGLMGNAGPVSGSGPQGGGVPMRIDPVTGQRLGEVTLQGPTLMTYCPSCQRPF